MWDCSMIGIWQKVQFDDLADLVFMNGLLRFKKLYIRHLPKEQNYSLGGRFNVRVSC